MQPSYVGRPKGLYSCVPTAHGPKSSFIRRTPYAHSTSILFPQIWATDWNSWWQLITVIQVPIHWRVFQLDHLSLHSELYICISIFIVPRGFLKLAICISWAALNRTKCGQAVPLLRRLVTGLSPRRAGLDPGSVHVGFVVDKVALGQVFFPEYFGFPLSISFNRCSITRKNEKTNHLHHRVAQ
jgi:hypothetical protein